jgi:hypothetical protein
MRRFITAVAAVAVVVAFSSMSIAQTAQASAKPQAEKTATKSAKPSVTGKIAKFDEATKTLTVTVKDAEKSFLVNAETKIHAGAKTLKSTALAVGTEVKVTYTETEGKMTATNIAVASAQAATTPAKK